METSQKVIITLLIIAIVFSVISLTMTLSLQDFASTNQPASSGSAAGASGAQVALVVEGSPQQPQGGSQ